MNKLTRNQKLGIAAILACVLVMSMSVVAFADGADGAGQVNYLTDPMFYRFIFLVVAFISAVVCSALIYSAIKNSKKEREYEEREGTVKLYEDLDDAKWDAPDSVFIPDMEPPAAILSELQPVKPVRGLDGFVIKEEPISTVTALNIGADPYAYRMGTEPENAVFEAVGTTPITAAEMNPPLEEIMPDEDDMPESYSGPHTQPEYSPFLYHPNDSEHPYTYESVRYSVLDDGGFIAENAQPIGYANVPKSSPFVHATAEDTAPFTPYTVPAAALHEEHNRPATLVDEAIPTEPATVGVTAAAVPKSNPASHIQDVPITIFTSGDEDGVVRISASIFESRTSAVVLENEVSIPVPETIHVEEAPLPKAE